jgi:nucleotide-binding universal stress UspA family protein
VELRGPIVSATDLTEAGDAALRQGHALAANLGARFVVCHVLPEAFSVRVLFPQDAGRNDALAGELGRKASAALEAQLTALALDDRVAPDLEIATGTPHGAMLSLAQRLGAGALVVGPGATAHRLARAADIPVLIARPSPAGGGVLGATDFSDPSLPALRTAAGEAQRRGVALRVVHCVDLESGAYAAGAGMDGVIAPWPFPAEVMHTLESAARTRLSNALSALGVKADALVVRQSPVPGIVAAARDTATALVVVGTRGRTGLSRLALGSTAEGVMDLAPCSVLVVPLNPA